MLVRSCRAQRGNHSGFEGGGMLRASVKRVGACSRQPLPASSLQGCESDSRSCPGPQQCPQAAPLLRLMRERRCGPDSPHSRKPPPAPCRWAAAPTHCQSTHMPPVRPKPVETRRRAEKQTKPCLHSPGSLVQYLAGRVRDLDRDAGNGLEGAVTHLLEQLSNSRQGRNKRGDGISWTTSHRPNTCVTYDRVSASAFDSEGAYHLQTCHGASGLPLG